MKRSTIPLVKTFGSAALSNVRMNLLASHSRMLLSIALLLVMMLVPSSMKGATTTMDFGDAGRGSFFHAQDPNNGKYNINVVMSDVSYNAIGNGAKVGNRIDYKYSNTGSVDISRLAFISNTAGLGNAHNTGDGFYLRREGGASGLYTGQWAAKLAILNLKPGDRVKIYFAATSDVTQWGAGINWQGYGWKDSGETVTISQIGDLIVEVNTGTIIQSITIDSDIAEYEITTNGNTTTFKFIQDGLLEQNDYAIPYLSASFGSINDFLVVQNLESHMYKSNGSEDLVTGGTNYQPSAGSFYAFKPTSSGTISVEGSLQGNQIHVFVYDPSVGTVGDWVEKVPGKFYRDTYTTGSFSFNVAKDKIYYICQDNTSESGNALHLRQFSFTHTFNVEQLGKIVDLETDVINGWIQLTKIEGAGGYEIKVKRCTANISPSIQTKIEHDYLYMSAPQFVEGTDNAGTVILDVNTDGGEVVFVATFPYHADYNPAGYTDTNRTYGHTWNFIDPRNSDSNIGNCLIRSGIASFDTGTTTGILSIGQYKDENSQFYHETQNREWTYSQRQTGQAGGFHDPYYMNVFDMVGDNADMIWETEGLWFDTDTNLSCLWNETDERDQNACNPLNFTSPGTDPDRYVGLLPDADSKSSFTIPGLKDGDRVLIFMKSGEATGANGIFLNIEGAKDALGKVINSNDLYKAGGTNWQHDRYEGCYHFIKNGNGNMKFTMVDGSMCKLLYIHIYTGQRISTNTIVSTGNKQDENGDDVLDENNKPIQDAGRILFMNDKGAEKGQYSNMSLRFRGKGQQQKTRVLTSSGNLNYSTTELKKNGTTNDSHFTVSGDYSQAVGYTSQVGEIGMFRMREMDVEYTEKYVADFSDRNFTVGYRDKVDSYPYTWDFTDIQGFSSTKMTDEADNYPIAAASQDEYGNQWDISLFDESGNMKVNTGFDPITDNLIFAPHKIGFGNQLWAGGDVIPEARGLWFYSEDDSNTNYTSVYSSSLYNDCLQITDEGISFCNAPDADGKRVPWWNYKMVVPDVENGDAVYLRMKRDSRVAESDKMFSDKDGKNVLFLNTRFAFGTGSKTSLTEDTQDVYLTQENGTNYSFYKVPGTNDEYILAVKNTTGATNHLTFTLNGWIVKKVAVSKDEKFVNVKGYASESRARVIDPNLTGYLTGHDVTSYIVTGAHYDDRSLDLTPVTKPIPYVAADESTETEEEAIGYIIQNKTKNEAKSTQTEDSYELEVLNSKFHLFVPDMHDTELMDCSSSMMTPQLTETSLSSYDGAYVNYVLSYKYYQLGGASGDEPVSAQQEGEEMFYRVSSKGIKLRDNSAYLKLLKEDVHPSGGTTTAKFTFRIVDWNDPVPTIIENANVVETFDAADGVWHNLNGQKLNGMPTTKGVYIVNGKKVLVK